MSQKQQIKQYSEDFKDFLLCIEGGFKRGQKTHGEHSNKRMDLMREVENELRDVACYAFFEYRKIRALREKIRGIKCRVR